jgi:hypothetical protein
MNRLSRSGGAEAPRVMTLGSTLRREEELLLILVSPTGMSSDTSLFFRLEVILLCQVGTG